MDSITHVVLGGVVGEAVAGKKLGRQALFWGALANSIPDIDVVTSFWMSQVDSLLAHRGFTHSFLFAIIFSPLFALAFNKWHPSKSMKFRDWLILFGSGIFIHIFIDALTCYGTGWYEPFHHHRVTMNILFVADPFYTFPLLISFVALLILKPQHAKRNFWMKFGLVLSSLYVLYAGYNKFLIDKHMKEELARQEISYSNYFSTPAPLNNFLWFLVAKSDSSYFLGYRSIFDKSDEIIFKERFQNEYLLKNVPQDYDLFKLKRFAKNYYTVESDNGSLFFNDIRFGTTGGWANDTADFVFRYKLDEGSDNDLIIQRGRMQSAGKDALKSLWERSLGK